MDKPPPTEHQQVVAAICDVCGWQIEMIGWGRVGKLSKSVRAVGGTADELREHYGQSDVGTAWWWYRDHWKGKLGQRPDDGWIRKTWGSWNLPIAVQQGGAAELVAYAMERRNGNTR